LHRRTLQATERSTNSICIVSNVKPAVLSRQPCEPNGIEWFPHLTLPPGVLIFRSCRGVAPDRRSEPRPCRREVRSMGAWEHGNKSLLSIEHAGRCSDRQSAALPTRSPRMHVCFHCFTSDLGHCLGLGPLPGIDIRHDLIENVHQSLPSHFFLSQHLSTKHHTFLPGNTSPVPRPRCKKTGRPRSSQRFSRLHRLIAKPSGEKSHGCSEYFSGAPSLLPSSLCLALHARETAANLVGRADLSPSHRP
jgi:hypothetical protein